MVRLAEDVRGVDDVGPKERHQVKLVGVDGCRAGWVVAISEVADHGSSSLSAPSFLIERTFRGLLDRLQGQRALVAVDIPIGLPSGVPRDNGRRRADAES